MMETLVNDAESPVVFVVDNTDTVEIMSRDIPSSTIEGNNHCVTPATSDGSTCSDDDDDTRKAIFVLAGSCSVLDKLCTDSL